MPRNSRRVGARPESATGAISSRSRRRTSIDSHGERSASTGTGRDRCRACRRVTTCSSVRSTSCGGRGARSRCGRTRSPTTLRRAGVTTMLVSDHPHLFEIGGENYHTDFSAWDYVRGHEGDPWRTRPDPTWTGTPALPAAPGFVHHAYDDSRTWFRSEEDFPGPRTMRAAEEWLRDERASSRPLPLVRRRVRSARAVRHARTVGDSVRRHVDGPATDLAAVLDRDDRERRLQPRRRARFAPTTSAKLAMIDHWLGRISTRSTTSQLWDDTAVVLCTDHGHYLGRAGHVRQARRCRSTRELGHTPLLVAWPGVEPRDVDALTTNVDLHATLADVFGVAPAHRTHGHSLVPLLDGRRDRRSATTRCSATGGVTSTSSTTNATTRARRSATNDPLAMWSNRWSTMPIHALPDAAAAAARPAARRSTSCPAPRFR